MRSVIYGVMAALVVIGAGGLVILGIAKVKDAGRTISCRNNLKQIGMCLGTFQDQNNELPSAAMPNSRLPPEKRLSWLVAIYPYVEASPLYSKMNKEASWDAEENRFAALTPRKVFQCPAYPEDFSVSTLVPSDYVGIAGIGSDAAALPASHPRAGFFGYDRKLSLADIKGYNSTLLVAADTGQASGSWTAAGPATVRGLEPNGPPYLAEGGPFGGFHWTGTNALMADGSVRLLSRDTSPEVFENMAILHNTESSPPEE